MYILSTICVDTMELSITHPHPNNSVPSIHIIFKIVEKRNELVTKMSQFEGN